MPRPGSRPTSDELLRASRSSARARSYTDVLLAATAVPACSRSRCFLGPIPAVPGLG